MLESEKKKKMCEVIILKLGGTQDFIFLFFLYAALNVVIAPWVCLIAQLQWAENKKYAELLDSDNDCN